MRGDVYQRKRGNEPSSQVQNRVALIAPGIRSVKSRCRVRVDWISENKKPKKELEIKKKSFGCWLGFSTDENGCWV